MAQALPPLALYIHLPWCERKCPYCDFNSHEASAVPEAEYVAQLLRDFAAEYGGEDRPLHSVFIGGGTPSLFSVDAIAELLSGIRRLADLEDDCELTLEANPGSTDNARLAGFAAAGVTRFSLGIQSFNDHSLERLGRIHDADTALAAAAAAGASGARSYNLDLMHGLPDQRREEGLEDLERALVLNPPHLSWYQLTIERNTRFYRERPVLPAEDVLASLEDAGAALLTAAGYERYEVSAWAKPGERCRHNLNYWTFGDYLAIGAGAHGKVTGSDGSIVRYHKTRAPADYLADTGIARRGTRALNADDRLGEFMMNALRLQGGFPRSMFSARTGLEEALLVERAAPLVADDLLSWEGDGLRCTALGWRYLDGVVGRFF